MNKCKIRGFRIVYLSIKVYIRSWPNIEGTAYFLALGMELPYQKLFVFKNDNM